MLTLKINYYGTQYSVTSYFRTPNPYSSLAQNYCTLNSAVQLFGALQKELQECSEFLIF